MNIIKQFLHNLFAQCLPSLLPSKTTISTTHLSYPIELKPISNLDSISYNITSEATPSISPSISPSINNIISLGDQGVKYQESLLLVNNPHLYNKLLDNFINNSDKVGELVSPEKDLADRAYNIHTIMGSNTNPLLLNTLKNKESLNKLLVDNTLQFKKDNDSLDYFEKLLNSLEETSMDITTLSNNTNSIDNILTDHSEAIKIALDILN